MPPRAKQPKAPILRYGEYWQATADPLQIELECIKKLGRWENHGRRCGKGLPYHAREACKLLWPRRYWHRWSDLICENFLSKPGRCGCFGPSSSQKSFTFTMLALAMFYARPKGTTGLISSTTKEDLQRRVWGYVLELDKEARELHPWLPGHFVESELKLLADAKDVEGRSRKDGIMGVACKKGGQWQGLEGYVGTKNEVLILVCDEAHFMPVGFLDALANLESNPLCYAGIMGNLPDVENPLGWACEPKNGWESLPDTEVSRAYETRWVNGRAVQLVGLDSPNFDFPAEDEHYKGLIGKRYIEQCRVNYGADSTKFHMFASGKVPQAGMHCTVFTKQECLKHEASASVMWGHEALHRGYGLDAAYSGLGGDRTVGFPFVWGRDVKGKMRFWLGPMHVYPGSRDPKVTHAEAIAVECKRQCEAAGIGPEAVYFDGTGRSELTSAFARLWSSEVVPLEFGGPATTRPTFTGELWRQNEKKEKSAGTLKTCAEVFDRFVTELWFALKWCIVADQMRGLPQEAIEEGSLRKFEIVRGGREAVETKEEMKERGLRSPDICFVAGTWIATPFGEEQVQNLKAGDSVLTPLGTATVAACQKRETNMVSIVKLSNGLHLTGTPDHKVFTWNRGWVRLDALILTDELEPVSDLWKWNLRSQWFTKVAHTSFKAQVDTIRTATGRVAWTGFYTDASGLKRMGRFLKAIASTTKTVIGMTIACATWSCCRFLSTLQCTLSDGCRTLNSGNSFTGIWKKLDSRPLGGMAQLKVENGTRNLERLLGLAANLVCAHANSAGTNIEHSRVVTALMDAPKSRATVSTWWKESVRSVAAAFKLTNTAHPSTAPTIAAQSRLDGSSKVYTLSLVEHNVYYANGILVANCDAVVCAIEGARRQGFPLGKHVTPAKKRDDIQWLQAMKEQERERAVKGLVAA